VDLGGRPQNIAVQQGFGLGLDERAAEAVRRWKFRPGYRDSRPSVTSALVQMTFRLV
jgi:hypothetical protein